MAKSAKSNHTKSIITALEVEGFKSLSDRSRIEISNLTILAGSNSSGKSSMMQPLLILRQTLEANYDPGALVIDGPSVKFTNSQQIFSKAVSGPQSDQISVFIERNCGFSIEGGYQRLPKGGIGPVRTILRSPTGSISVKPDTSSENLRRGMVKTFIGHPIVDLFGEMKEKWFVQKDRCFLLPGHSDMTMALQQITNIPSISGNIEDCIQDVIHLPALRGNPERTYRTTAHGPRFPGLFEIYVASIIHQWKQVKAKELRQLGSAMETIGLTWKVEPKRVEETRVEIQVGRLPHSVRGGARDLISIADVGFGLSQVLPVVVALLAAKPGQLVYIEQPEIHLHPRAQVNLAKVLADAAKRGVRVVIETHSARLLLALQTLVAEGVLPSELVKLHWFSRSSETGMTKITSGGIDEMGSFDDWPEDFGQVELDQESRFLDVVGGRQFG